VPIVKDGQVLGVLDVDSEHLAHFDETDKKYLEELIEQLVARGIF
jgi:L-methionine (R)-S-oxide reductase